VHAHRALIIDLKKVILIECTDAVSVTRVTKYRSNLHTRYIDVRER
jgi:hypothetical protein